MGQVTARTREVSDACSKVSRLHVCVCLSISLSLPRLQVLAINPHTKGTQSVQQSVCVCVCVCVFVSPHFFQHNLTQLKHFKALTNSGTKSECFAYSMLQICLRLCLAFTTGWSTIAHFSFIEWKIFTRVSERKTDRRTEWLDSEIASRFRELSGLGLRHV